MKKYTDFALIFDAHVMLPNFTEVHRILSKFHEVIRSNTKFMTVANLI